MSAGREHDPARRPERPDQRAGLSPGDGTPPPGGTRAGDEGRPHPRTRTRRRRLRDALLAGLARLLPGVGPRVARAARGLGALAPYAPDAHWSAGDPIEQVRAYARDAEMSLVAAAISLTLSLEAAAIKDYEPRVLTLRNRARPYSMWWQSRLSPSSLPPRPVGPPARADVLRTPEPGTPPQSPPAPPTGRGGSR
jgi:hypothetical protein